MPPFLMNDDDHSFRWATVEGEAGSIVGGLAI